MEEVPDDCDVVVISHLKSELRDWGEWFIAHKFNVRVIVMVRDPWVQRRSRAKAAGKSIDMGMTRYMGDYLGAFELLLDKSFPFTLVPYECLLWDGSPERVLSLWGMAPYQTPLVVQGEQTKIRDANGKWYAGS